VALCGRDGRARGPTPAPTSTARAGLSGLVRVQRRPWQACQGTGRHVQERTVGAASRRWTARERSTRAGVVRNRHRARSTRTGSHPSPGYSAHPARLVAHHPRPLDVAPGVAPSGEARGLSAPRRGVARGTGEAIPPEPTTPRTRPRNVLSRSGTWRHRPPGEAHPSVSTVSVCVQQQDTLYSACFIAFRDAFRVLCLCVLKTSTRVERGPKKKHGSPAPVDP
jgi:hypothetical protein